MKTKKFEIEFKLNKDLHIYEISINYSTTTEDYSINYLYDLETAEYVDFGKWTKRDRMLLEDTAYRELMYSDSFSEDNLF